MKTPEQRFWEKVGPHDDPTACWIWLGGTSAKREGSVGYGQFSVSHHSDQDREQVLAHIFSYRIRFGPIPKGLTLDHRCRNTLCVNPMHLEPVPNKVNILRGFGCFALNAKRATCLHGHPFTKKNTYVWHGKRQCRTCRRERHAAWLGDG